MAINISKTKIRFIWDINYICNYRCSYCWFNRKWEKYRKFNKYLPVSKVIDCWDKILTKYGPAHIEIAGGEPILYPGFINLVSELGKNHRVEVSTNLSVELDWEKLEGRNIKIHPSFHPQFADLDELLKTELKLIELDLNEGGVSMVAWPPMLEDYHYYKKKFAEKGIVLYLQTFHGRYMGKIYPESYCHEEKKILDIWAGTRGGKKFQQQRISFKGKMCNAGYLYGAIKPNGDVRRCGTGDEEVIGNFFEEDFTMMSQPYVCNSDECKCNEWAFLILE